MAQSPAGSAEKAVELCIQILNGDTVEKENLIDTYMMDLDYINNMDAAE